MDDLRSEQSFSQSEIFIEDNIDNGLTYLANSLLH
jgi:hypothetical protein